MIDYESLSNTLYHFANSGYEFEFQAEPSGIYCAALDLRLAPDEFDISEVYHFDETVSPQGGIMLYLITSFVGIKGTLMVTAADVFSEDMSFEMAQKLRMNPYGEWICS